MYSEEKVQELGWTVSSASLNNGTCLEQAFDPTKGQVFLRDSNCRSSLMYMSVDDLALVSTVLSNWYG